MNSTALAEGQVVDQEGDGAAAPDLNTLLKEDVVQETPDLSSASFAPEKGSSLGEYKNGPFNFEGKENSDDARTLYYTTLDKEDKENEKGIGRNNIQLRVAIDNWQEYREKSPKDKDDPVADLTRCYEARLLLRLGRFEDAAKVFEPLFESGKYKDERAYWADVVLEASRDEKLVAQWLTKEDVTEENVTEKLRTEIYKQALGVVSDPSFINALHETPIITALKHSVVLQNSNSPKAAENLRRAYLQQGQAAEGTKYIESLLASKEITLNDAVRQALEISLAETIDQEYEEACNLVEKLKSAGTSAEGMKEALAEQARLGVRTTYQYARIAEHYPQAEGASYALYSAVFLAYSRGEYQDVLRYAQAYPSSEALQDHPYPKKVQEYLDDVLHLKALANYRTEKYSDAEVNFEKLLSTYPKDDKRENWQRHLIYSKVELGKHQEALSVYKDMKKEFPDSENLQGLLDYLAVVQYQAKEYSSAAVSYRELAENYPEEAKREKWLHYAVDSELEAGNHKNALAVFKEMEKDYPTSEHLAGDFEDIVFHGHQQIVTLAKAGKVIEAGDEYKRLIQGLSQTTQSQSSKNFEVVSDWIKEYEKLLPYYKIAQELSEKGEKFEALADYLTLVEIDAQGIEEVQLLKATALLRAAERSTELAESEPAEREDYLQTAKEQYARIAAEFSDSPQAVTAAERLKGM